MGQYYKPSNLNKEESLYSHDYGNGLKLMEHSYVGNDFVNAVVMLLAEGWKNDPIVWAGDYADPDEDILNEDQEPMTIYARDFKEIKVPTDDFSYKYILNHDREEFVNIQESGEEWQIHPLPLLTCEGNGRGGGDYMGDDPNGLIGLWSRNHLEAVKENLTEYSELVFDLKED
jgi:hypothetical protein